MLIYYNGGIEIIIFGRLGNFFFKFVIDIKEILECNVFGRYQCYVVFGLVFILIYVLDLNVFLFLSKIVLRVVDCIVWNKIILGGNIVGEICYREVVFLFLLVDSILGIVGMKGICYVFIYFLFIERL